MFNNHTYCIINAYIWRGATFRNGIKIPVVYNEKTSRLDAFIEVCKSLTLLSLVPVRIQEMGEGVSQAKDCVESSVQKGLNIVIKSYPVCFLNNWKKIKLIDFLPCTYLT